MINRYFHYCLININHIQFPLLTQNTQYHKLLKSYVFYAPFSENRKHIMNNYLRMTQKTHIKKMTILVLHNTTESLWFLCNILRKQKIDHKQLCTDDKENTHSKHDNICIRRRQCMQIRSVNLLKAKQNTRTFILLILW